MQQKSAGFGGIQKVFLGLETPVTPNVPTVILSIVALGLLHAIVLTVEASASHSGFFRATYAVFPVPLTRASELAITLCRLGEALSLALMFRSLNAGLSAKTVVPVIAGAVWLIGTSLAVSVVDSDMYYYIYYAKAPTLAVSYAANAAPYEPTPGFESLPSLLHRGASLPSPYGPLWKVSSGLLLAQSHSIDDSIMRLKLEQTFFLVLAFLALFACRLPWRYIAMFALNPTLYEDFISEGHNDIIGVAFVLVGLALAFRRHVWFAVAAAGIAPLFKILILPGAIAALATFGSRTTRLVSAVAIATIALAGSLLFGKLQYVHALLSIAHVEGGVSGSHSALIVRYAIQFALVCVGLFAIVLSIFRKRFLATAVWAFGAMSPLAHIWYFPWGLAYAVRSCRALVLFSISMPLIAVAADTSLTELVGIHLEGAVLGIIAMLALYEITTTHASGQVAVPYFETRMQCSLE